MDTKTIHRRDPLLKTASCDYQLTTDLTDDAEKVTCSACKDIDAQPLDAPPKPRSAAGKKAAATRAANKEKRLAAAARMAAKASPKKAAPKAKTPKKTKTTKTKAAPENKVHLFGGCGQFIPEITSTLAAITCPACRDSAEWRRRQPVAPNAKLIAFEGLQKGELDIAYLSQLLTAQAQGESMVPGKGWVPVEGDYTITPEEAAELGQLLALQGQLVRRAQALYERVRDAAVEAVSK